MLKYKKMNSESRILSESCGKPLKMHYIYKSMITH